jgi:GTP cyclohydrolase I
MAMRGVRIPDEMATSAMLGRFRDGHEVRAEFLALAGQART